VPGARALARLLTATVVALAPLTGAAQDLSCERGDREVRSLRFRGNREFPDDILAAAIATQPSSLAGVPLVGQRRCLDPGEFARDVQRLELLYRRRGFPDVRVDTVVRAVRPSVIEVTFTIVEGVPLRVSAFTLLGTDAHPAIGEAARDFPIRVGGRFDRGALEAGRDSLVRRLRNAGWPQAEALLAYATDVPDRTATVEVRVVPGPRARLGRIAVEVETASGGRRHATDAMIARTMGLRTGDWYSARDLIEAQRSLYQTDAFLRVDLAPDSAQPPGDSIVNLTVRLLEGDRYAARGGVGWATLDCFRAQGTLADRDFLSWAQRLELNGRVSKIGIGAPLDGAPELCQAQARADPYSRTLNYYGSVTLRQPAQGRQARIPTLTLFSSTLSEYKAFLRRTPIGGAVSVTNPLQSRVPSTLAYQVELGRTEAEPAFFCAVFNACDAEARGFLRRNSRLAALDYTLTASRYDDPLRPARGLSVRLGLRHASTAIGSDRTQQFNRGTADVTWLQALGGGVTLTAHARGGVVYGGGTSPTIGGFVPPQERLYAGGPTTVRGYRQNELGPAVYIVSGYAEVDSAGATFFRTDSATVAERVVPTGGNTVVIGNVELQMPMPFAARLLQFALFADAGRLWNRGGPGEALADEGPFLQVTPGFGVRVASPFGAIRVDLGYNPYRLPAGAAYFNAPLQAGVAPLYCVSPGNALAVTPGVGGAPPTQAGGACPATYRPERSTGLLGRFNPSIWIGQAF
jgi:outer membrane protein insertion porin family/translocation and assembly module TamA